MDQAHEPPHSAYLQKIYAVPLHNAWWVPALRFHIPELSGTEEQLEDFVFRPLLIPRSIAASSKSVWVVDTLILFNLCTVAWTHLVKAD